jgi:hypothetical protein
MKTEFIYIKLDSDFDKALELAKVLEPNSWADLTDRVIATKGYDKVAYGLAVAGFHFTKWN